MILFCTTQQSDNSKIHASEICVLCLDFFQTNNFSIFPHHPYTNLSGINLHRCCKIQRSVQCSVCCTNIALQHCFCAGRVDDVLVVVARPAVQLPEQLS